MMTSSVTSVALQFVSLLPGLAVWVVGFIILVMGWGRLPKVRILALIALGIQIIAGPSFAVVYYVLPRVYGTGVMAYRGVGFVHSLVNAVSWALMLWALLKALKGAGEGAEA